MNVSVKIDLLEGDMKLTHESLEEYTETLRQKRKLISAVTSKELFQN